MIPGAAAGLAPASASSCGAGDIRKAGELTPRPFFLAAPTGTVCGEISWRVQGEFRTGNGQRLTPGRLRPVEQRDFWGAARPVQNPIHP